MYYWVWQDWSWTSFLLVSKLKKERTVVWSLRHLVQKGLREFLVICHHLFFFWKNIVLVFVSIWIPDVIWNRGYFFVIADMDSIVYTGYEHLVFLRKSVRMNAMSKGGVKIVHLKGDLKGDLQ